MLVSIRKITKSFGDKTILNGIDLDIDKRARIGLVGRNGAGKSTLANILTGHEAQDEGQLVIGRPGLKTGYLRQTETEPEVLIDLLANSDREDSLPGLLGRLGLQRIEGWTAERMQNLSGGEKTKLALAQVWAAQPDLVILDEPTNHMDHQGIEFLISELARFKGAAVIISHDRYFLDRTVTQIAALENGHLKLYSGNYSMYRQTRQQERESQWHQYTAEQKEQRKIDQAVQQLKAWSDKAHRESRQKAMGAMGGKEYYRKKAKKRDQAIKSQIKRLEKMRQDGVERPDTDPRVKFNMDTAEKKGRRILQAENISKSYGWRCLFQESSFYVNRGEKVGITGPNGCGKTTLIKMMLGQSELDSGELFLSPAARVAYISQELPQGEAHCLKDLIKYQTSAEQKQTIQLLIALGIAYDRMDIPLGELSRGERMKIDMGLAIQGENDLLILDEPTNHLDIYSREALEESLLNFAGTVLLISHDRYLVDKVCDCNLVFREGRIIRMEGQLSRYLDAPLAQNVSEASGGSDQAEETLLLETKITRVLSELSLARPGEARYAVLEQEYRQLLQRRKQLRGK